MISEPCVFSHFDVTVVDSGVFSATEGVKIASLVRQISSSLIVEHWCKMEAEETTLTPKQKMETFSQNVASGWTRGKRQSEH